MSFYATTWARHLIESHDLRAGEQLVLLTLADHANRDTGFAWPGRSRLIAATHLSESTVKRAVRRLRDLIPAHDRPGGGIVWLFPPDPTAQIADPSRVLADPPKVIHTGVTLTPPKLSTPGSHRPRGGSHRTGGGVTLTPKPVKNQQLTTAPQVSEHPAIRAQRQRDLLEISDRQFARSTTTIAATVGEPSDMAWFDDDVQTMLATIRVRG